MKFPDKCPDCFWNDVSLENWQTFETKTGIDRATKIKEIKDKKCLECINGSNFRQILTCQKYGNKTDGHNHIYHDQLCDNCWTKENSQ